MTLGGHVGRGLGAALVFALTAAVGCGEREAAVPPQTPASTAAADEHTDAPPEVPIEVRGLLIQRWGEQVRSRCTTSFSSFLSEEALGRPASGFASAASDPERFDALWRGFFSVALTSARVDADGTKRLVDFYAPGTGVVLSLSYSETLLKVTSIWAAPVEEVPRFGAARPMASMPEVWSEHANLLYTDDSDHTGTPRRWSPSEGAIGRAEERLLQSRRLLAAAGISPSTPQSPALRVLRYLRSGDPEVLGSVRTPETEIDEAIDQHARVASARREALPCTALVGETGDAYMLVYASASEPDLLFFAAFDGGVLRHLTPFALLASGPDKIEGDRP